MTIELKQQRQRRYEDLPSADPERVDCLKKDHPAILQKTTLFQSSVIQASDAPRVLVSGQNNRKIGRVVTKGIWSGFPIYALTLPERMTCPTSCHMYFSCYGNAMPFARRHLPGKDLELKIHQEVGDLSRQHPLGFLVRLHVLGDFYSVDYVKMWRDLVTQHEQLHIYGYTATGDSAEIEVAEISAAIESLNDDHPGQVFIRFSSRTALPGGACVIDYEPDKPTVEEGVVCPAERDATACCATCGFCWEPASREKTVVFVKHGMGSRGPTKIASKANGTDETGKRRISPIKELAQVAGQAQNNPPTMLWVDPCELWIDPSYQRDLSGRSMSLISKMVSSWNWTHFKPPIVVKDEDTDQFWVLDGQHTSIAAASHPSIDKIPIMVVDAEDVGERARAFIGHNKDRVSVTALQLHFSALTAGDEEAIEIDRVCVAAGVRLLKAAPPRSQFQAGETVAIGAIRSMIRSRGAKTAEGVLKCLASAGRAPVRADEIKALGYLFDQRSCGPVDIISALKSNPYEKVVSAARRLKDTTGIPATEAMATVLAKWVSERLAA